MGKEYITQMYNRAADEYAGSEEDIICNVHGCGIEDDKKNIIVCLLCWKDLPYGVCKYKDKALHVSIYVCTECSEAILQI